MERRDYNHTRLRYDTAQLQTLVQASQFRQVQLARQLGVTPVHLSRMLRGHASQATLARLCLLLGCDYRFLLSSPKEISALEVDKLNL